MEKDNVKSSKEIESNIKEIGLEKINIIIDDVRIQNNNPNVEGDRDLSILSLESSIDKEYIKEFNRVKPLTNNELNEIKKYADEQLEEIGLEKGLLDKFIDGYKIRFNTTKVGFNEIDAPIHRTTLLHYAGINNIQSQMNGGYNNNINYTNVYYTNPYVDYNESTLNTLLLLLSDNMFDTSPSERKFKKIRIYFCRDNNKNVNLVISFRSFYKSLWDQAPEGFVRQISIPLVMNGEIENKISMFKQDISAGYSIDNDWLNILVEKIKEWFGIEINLV